MKKLSAIVLSLMVFAGANALYAQHADGHDCMGGGHSCCTSHGKSEGASISSITRSTLQEAIRANNVVVFDARGAEEFAAGHIDGAVVYASDKLPADKNAKLVFYCGGGRCTKSATVAKKVKAMGYKNVMVYSGGWSDWHRADS